MRFRAVAIAALLLPALGCLPLPATGGAPQTVQIENAATVPARIRIGPFKPGAADVSESTMVAEQVVAAKGRASFSIATGRYNLEAVAITPKGEIATTNFTLTDRPVGLRLHETLIDNQPIVSPSASPSAGPQTERLRQLSWVEI